MVTFEDCLVSVQRFPGPSRSIHFVTYLTRTGRKCLDKIRMDMCALFFNQDVVIVNRRKVLITLVDICKMVDRFSPTGFEE